MEFLSSITVYKCGVYYIPEKLQMITTFSTYYGTDLVFPVYMSVSAWLYKNYTESVTIYKNYISTWLYNNYTMSVTMYKNYTSVWTLLNHWTWDV